MAKNTPINKSKETHIWIPTLTTKYTVDTQIVNLHDGSGEVRERSKCRESGRSIRLPRGVGCGREKR